MNTGWKQISQDDWQYLIRNLNKIVSVPRQLNPEYDARYLRNRAVENFDFGIGFIDGIVSVTLSGGENFSLNPDSARTHIINVLFEQFVLDVDRLRRVITHKDASLSIPSLLVERFKKDTSRLHDIRRFIEHREDPNGIREEGFPRNFVIEIDGSNAFFSQASLYIHSRDRIYYGDVNLVEIRDLVEGLFTE